MVLGALAFIVVGDGEPQVAGWFLKGFAQADAGDFGGSVGQFDSKDFAGGALLKDEKVLGVGAEGHEIRFPVSRADAGCEVA
jgi:hypothetical protein